MNFQNLPSKIGFGNKSYSILRKKRCAYHFCSNADQKVFLKK